MEEELKNKLWAVGGGKGGVGKSIVVLMLGAMLARQGKKVVLVDADLGGSNLHTLVGIKYPTYTLADFIKRQVESIEDVIMATPVENLQLICGADDILGLANPKSTQKTRLFNHLKRLDADMILLDLGAGTSFTSIDFFLYAPNKIVVLTPQITSVQNAYGFIKTSLYRRLSMAFSKDAQCLELINRLVSSGEEGKIDSIAELKEAFMVLGEEQQAKLIGCLEEFRIGLVVNMVRGQSESEVGCIVQTVANNYLSIYPDYLGAVNYDRILGMSINRMAQFLTKSADSMAGICLYDIAGKIIRKDNQKAKEVVQNSAVI